MAFVVQCRSGLFVTGIFVGGGGPIWSGTVDSINITSKAGEPMHSVAAAVATPGVGLEGDRYASRRGTFYKPEPDRQLTLIETEAVEALQNEYGVELKAGEARRNIVTRNVMLTHLVGKESMVGEVRVRGIRLCEPCDHLQRITGRSLLTGLRHRGGLRAQILTGGTIHPGDRVSEPGVREGSLVP